MSTGSAVEVYLPLMTYAGYTGLRLCTPSCFASNAWLHQTRCG